MGRKGKDKPKLRKYEMEVEGRIIDLRRFAYDYLVFSVRKFGIPMSCIVECDIEENIYHDGYLIEVIGRMLLGLQISHRHSWYVLFQRYYEETKFVSFPDVKRALLDVLNDETLRAMSVVLMRATAYLSVISELILFLYTANCNLFFMELALVWPEFVRSDLRLCVRHGGIGELYNTFNTHEGFPIDEFFRLFIPKFCIPYNEASDLCDIYVREKSKISDRLNRLASEESSIRNTIDVDTFIEMTKTSEQVGASETTVPTNTGLGIRPHEEWLQLDTRQLDIETEVSPQSVPSTSGHDAARIRKEKMKRTPSSRATEEPGEEVKVDLLGTPSATLRRNLPVGSYQETPRDYTESIRRDGQRTSSILSREDIERVTSSFVSNVPSQPGTSSQETSGARKKTNRKKKKKSSSSVSREVHQQSDIAGATSAVPPPPGTSGQKTTAEMDSILSEELKKLYLSCSKEEPLDDDKQM